MSCYQLGNYIQLCPTHKSFLKVMRRIKTNTNTDVYTDVVPIPKMIDGWFQVQPFNVMSLNSCPNNRAGTNSVITRKYIGCPSMGHTTPKNV